MNLGFADALRRRLGPTWPPQQHCADWVSASSAFATLRRHFCRSRRCHEEGLLLLLLLGLLCLLRFLRFLRHIALQAMSEWRHRNDAYPNRHAAHSDYYRNRRKTPNLLTNSLW